MCQSTIYLQSTAGIIPNVRQTAGEMPMLISLVDSGMGVAVLPASAVKVSVASVVACEIADKIPMSEIGIAVQKGKRAPVIDHFRSLALRSYVEQQALRLPIGVDLEITGTCGSQAADLVRIVGRPIRLARRLVFVEGAQEPKRSATHVCQISPEVSSHKIIWPGLRITRHNPYSARKAGYVEREMTPMYVPKSFLSRYL